MQLTPQSRKVLSLLATVLVIAALWWVQQQSSSPDSNNDGSSQSARDSSGDGDGNGETDPDSGLPIIDAADLPAEARETLELIDDGGPFPYDRDGITFENREDILPDQQMGYYKEYTVPTPGSGDRGARRIVTGSSDEFYWTDDHYSSFSRIAR